MSATPIPSMDEQEAKRRAEWLNRNNAPFDWVVLTIEEVAAIRADLARVTAEREEQRKLAGDYCASWVEARDEADALRARVAELEKELEETWNRANECECERAKDWDACDALDARAKQAEARVAELEEKAERYRLTTLRQDATIAELATDGNAATLAANLAAVSQRNAELETQLEMQTTRCIEREERLAQAEACIADREQRNAELVAALRETVGMLEELDGLDWGEEGMPFSVDFDHFAKLLARAESATPAKHCEDCAPEFGCFDGGEPCYKQPLAKSTPAKHPDTERLDWLDSKSEPVTYEDARPATAWRIETDPGERIDLRAAIDAARKQGGAT